MRAVAALIALVGVAHAEPPVAGIRPDPRALEQAREANLAPTSVREGFAIGVALGPAVQFGIGLGDASGGGGGFDLRLGTVVSPRVVWLIELATTAFPHDGTVNQSGVLTFGGQYYANDAFWLRAGLGFASFTRRGDGADAVGGLGALGAGGLDVARWGGLALSVELTVTMALYRRARVVGVAPQLGLSWY